MGKRETLDNPEVEADGLGNPIRRDRWGRYLLPRPDGGRAGPWQRATTFISKGDDTYALGRWERRLMLRGLATDLSLLGIKVRKGKAVAPAQFSDDELDYIADECKKAAGSDEAADLGTALHKVLEDLDRHGEMPDPNWADWVWSYTRCLAEVGLEPVPELVERVVVTDDYGAGRVLGVAGTVDRWYRCRAGLRTPDGRLLSPGTLLIGDIKTGARGPEDKYAGPKMARQLAMYQACPHMWDGKGYDKAPDADRDWGVVVHAPVKAQALVRVAWVDLRIGREGINVCQQVVEREAVEPVAPDVQPFLAAQLQQAVRERATADPKFSEAVKADFKKAKRTNKNLKTLNELVYEDDMVEEALAEGRVDDANAVHIVQRTFGDWYSQSMLWWLNALARLGQGDLLNEEGDD